MNIDEFSDNNDDRSNDTAQSSRLCMICDEELFDYNVTFCDACPTEMCNACGRNLFGCESDCCDKQCNKEQFHAYDKFCYRCILKDCKKWCRDKNCESNFNILRLFPRVLDLNLAHEEIPGSYFTLQRRYTALEDAVNAIQAAGGTIQKLTKSVLAEKIANLNYEHLCRSTMNKSELCTLLQGCIEREKRFFAQNHPHFLV